MADWRDIVAGRLGAIDAMGRRRTIRALDGHGPAFTLDDGREVVSFASNDYLGLTQHPSVRAAARDAIEQWGTGSGSARLIVGDRPIHRELEAELAAWKHEPAALLFPTGFAANLGVLTALGDAGVRIISDELNHASIIDACRLARADTAIARHCDVDHVRALLAEHDGPAIVVTDAVFSMDGDVAPLDDLADLCAEFGALLVVDEAHAVLGPETPDRDGVDRVRIGTLSKALGALGGFAAAGQPIIDLLINAARSFIFTTAPTPADCAAALAAVRIVRGDDGAALRRRLADHVDRVAPGHPSPIIPIVLGDEQRALEATRQLLDDHGLLVPAIRPPTVAPNTCRLRVALSAAHTDEQIERLVKGLDAIR